MGKHIIWLLQCFAFSQNLFTKISHHFKKKQEGRSVDQTFLYWLLLYKSVFSISSYYQTTHILEET